MFQSIIKFLLHSKLPSLSCFSTPNNISKYLLIPINIIKKESCEVPSADNTFRSNLGSVHCNCDLFLLTMSCKEVGRLLQSQSVNNRYNPSVAKRGIAVTIRKNEHCEQAFRITKKFARSHLTEIFFFMLFLDERNQMSLSQHHQRVCYCYQNKFCPQCCCTIRPVMEAK